MDLTGCPTEEISFPEDKEHIKPRSKDNNQIWETLLDYDSQGFLMTSETSGLDTYTENGGPDSKAGLVPGHAYSLIQVKEKEDDGTRLLMVRNPWGTFEWDGAWADESEEWTEEMIDYFEPNFDTEDGAFWISYEDFLINFDSV